MPLRLFVHVLVLVGALGLTGCSPSFSPLYRDFTVAADTAASAAVEEAVVLSRAAEAVQQAGWMLTEPAAAGTVQTERRTLSRWGLYRVTAWLEVVPAGDRSVRVFIHPARQYVTGGRSKIGYLKPSLRRQILPDLTEAFDDAGLTLMVPRLDD